MLVSSTRSGDLKRCTDGNEQEGEGLKKMVNLKKPVKCAWCKHRAANPVPYKDLPDESLNLFFDRPRKGRDGGVHLCDGCRGIIESVK